MMILVVEDNALLAFMLEDSLVQAGHTVLGPVPSVRRALALVETRLPDLALVDINLQGPETGVDLALALQARGVPTIYATGQVEMARQGAAHALGVLAKPFPPEAVVAVSAAVQRWRGGAEPDFPREMERFETGLPAAPVR